MNTIKDGTYELIAGEFVRTLPVTNGYWVARKGFELIIPAQHISESYIENLLEDYRLDILTVGGFLGVWTNPDTGSVHFDISDHYLTYNQALQAARDNHQISFYDCAKDETIPSSAPFVAKLEGFTGISSLSADNAFNLARGMIARKNQTLL